MVGASVVVPAYNNRRFIDATIQSILTQTYTDFELIVADHTSDDGTWEALQRYAGDERVRLLRTPPGGGAPGNWARVTAEATGPYVKLVCGDDLLSRTCLAEQVAALDAHPAVALVASQRSLIDASGRVVVRTQGLAGLVGEHPGRCAVRCAVRSGRNIFGEPACVLMRREALVDAGGWDGRNPYVIDQATYSNVLLTQGGFCGLPGSLASFRLSADQWSRALATQQAVQVIALHERLAREHPGLLSVADLRLGNTRARIRASARRLTYFTLDHFQRLRGGGRQTA